MRKFIIFLVRKRLGLKKFERFQFVGQKSNAMYYFTDDDIMKVTECGKIYISGVSLHWILDDECKVTHVIRDVDELEEWVVNGD